MFGEHRHAALPFPTAATAQVWLDFDGTITQRDVLDDLIQRYAANDSWRLIEERWQAGLIGSRECLRQEFELIRISAPELDLFLDGVLVDPGIGRLLATLRHHHVPAAILSDGIDWFIQRVLERNDIVNLPIRSNTLLHKGQRLALRCPHESSACTAAAAHCKCASADLLRRPGRQTIYVGDGRSDLCPSRKANAVFAKGALAQALIREGVTFTPFITLNDVAETLEAAWAVSTPALVPSAPDTELETASARKLAAPRSA